MNARQGLSIWEVCVQSHRGVRIRCLTIRSVWRVWVITISFTSLAKMYVFVKLATNLSTLRKPRLVWRSVGMASLPSTMNSVMTVICSTATGVIVSAGSKVLDLPVQPHRLVSVFSLTNPLSSSTITRIRSKTKTGLSLVSHYFPPILRFSTSHGLTTWVLMSLRISSCKTL